jgi:RNA polymerase sigma-70 factor (ECF subfamily)
MNLVKAARKGREDAFQRLFDEHHLPLFRFAFRLTGSAADAEDIVQESFLGLLRAECLYDPQRASVRSYLFGAVRNQALKRQRHREKADDAADSVDCRSPETEAMRAELEDTVARAVMCLPENQRAVLILAHYERMPLAEIAQVMEIEVGAVKSRLQRARASMKEVLAAYAPRKDGYERYGAR